MIETGNLQQINANRVIFLDWLRAIACLMVLIVHASECIYSNDYSFYGINHNTQSIILFHFPLRQGVGAYV